MSKKYRIDPIALYNNPRMSTQLDGVPVSLCDEDLTVERPGNAGGPPLRLVAKKATQEQLARLFRERHPFVQEYENEDEVSQVAKPVAKSELPK